MTDFSGQYLGRYYLSERLGEGGMAVVYKAYDTRLERDVAIKIIRSGAFPTDALSEVLKRFEREAKSLAKLSHPNIVKVYDYGEHDGSPYLVMEYLPGGTLKKSLGKCVPWQEAVRLILPVARGVAYAHQRGILHRDIKPANILITESGEPMLSDFGIAKLFEGEQTTALTGSGMAIGTPEYMAPEQWTGKTSPHSDLYSLGIVLYEMVTGRKPYAADTPAAILIKQATEPLPRPRKFAVELPEALEVVLIKALAKEPNDRYKDVNAFIDALENLYMHSPVVLSTREPVSSAPTHIPARDDGETVKVSEKTEKVKETQDFETGTTDNVQPINEMKTPRQQEIPKPVAKKKVIQIHPRTSRTIVIGLLVLAGFTFLWSPRLSTIFAIVTPTYTPAPTITPTATSLPTELVDARGVTLHLVPAGVFTMGRDKGGDRHPAHQVRIDVFYMDVYEVTNVFYKACVEARRCEKPENFKSRTRENYYDDPQYNLYPVIYVNWDMAKAYCEWRGARLPTEAEWEYAARGTDGRTYPWGEGLDNTFANYNLDVGDTTEVGSYEKGKGPFGMYDMAGNVWEWIADWYDAYPGNTDSNSDFGKIWRVMRGSSFLEDGYFVHSDNRDRYLPTLANHYIGFRCARDATP